MITVGADSAESTDDAMIAKSCKWVGAQTVSAVVIGKAGLAVDDQIDVEVGKFMPTVLKQLGVMLDSLGRCLRKGDILIATAVNSGEIAGTGVFLEVPVSIETGGGVTIMNSQRVACSQSLASCFSTLRTVAIWALVSWSGA